LENDLPPERDPEKFKSCIIFVTTRLGLSEIDPCYFNSIKSVFSMKNCIGILGNVAILSKIT